MKSYKYILFDLDGTLTEPAEGITNAVKYALKKYGITEVTTEELLKFIGPPLRDSFQEFYGFSEEQAEEATAYYREYYSVTGLFENKLYEGIPELLQKLKDAGKILLVATSKPEEFTNRILEKFDIAKYFDVIAGATMDSTRNKKSDIIRYALELAKVEKPEEAVMIGDRYFDINGAMENKIDSIGILYGYGNREEFVEAGATYILEKVAALECLCRE